MSQVQHHEAEAEAARARIVATVEELADRLSPQTIIREAKADARQAVFDARDEGLRKLSGVRDSAVDAIDEVEDFIRENAVPVGLAAAAIGIAATVARRSGEPSHDRYADAGGDEYTRYAHGDDYATDAARSRARPLIERAKRGFVDLRESVSDAAERTASAANAARDAAAARLRRASASVGESASAASERLASGIDQLRDSATDTVSAAQRTVLRGATATGDAVTENPEVTVLLALAGGALMALVAAPEPRFGSER